ncbi:NAD(P)-binding protein [Cadophora sp. DSE1049]|nr:NAD(P)-binding protein [Cadophora sp. DSE1049]
MALQVFGKTALVTGGGSDICLAFTKLLLANNCNVLIADLQLLPEAEALVNSSTPSSTTNGNSNSNGVNGGGGKARAVFQKTDVMDWGQLEKAFERVVTEFGSVELVVPGAGVFEPSWSNFWHPNFKTSPSTPETSTYKTLEINLTHPIRCTQLALDVFKRQSPTSSSSSTRHTILHITSIAAQLPLLPVPLYAASKAGLSSFIRSLAPLEPHSNIRVAAVAPAIVNTPIWSERRNWVDEKVDVWIGPERIAEVMLGVVQGEEFVGGTVLEIGLESVRRVEGVGDPGPDMSARGYSVGGIGEGVVGTFGLLEKNFGN